MSDMDRVRVLEAGDIFDCGANAITVPVNCEGIMGAGLAEKFKTRCPDSSRDYATRCKRGDMKPGDIYHIGHYTDALKLGIRRTIFLATKDSWRNPSRIEWVKRGLDELVDEFDPAYFDFGTDKDMVLAVPALGCGYGQLSWDDVRPLILDASRRMSAVKKILIFAPQDTPELRTKRRTRK